MFIKSAVLTAKGGEAWVLTVGRLVKSQSPSKEGGTICLTREQGCAGHDVAGVHYAEPFHNGLLLVSVLSPCLGF